jgi:hypothetical protein
MHLLVLVVDRKGGSPYDRKKGESIMESELTEKERFGVFISPLVSLRLPWDLSILAR